MYAQAAIVDGPAKRMQFRHVAGNRHEALAVDLELGHIERRLREDEKLQKAALQRGEFDIDDLFLVDFHPPQQLVFRPIDVIEVLAVVYPNFKRLDKSVGIIRVGKKADAVDGKGGAQIPEEGRSRLTLGGLKYAFRGGCRVAVDEVERALELVEEAVIRPRPRLSAEGEVRGLAVEKGLSRGVEQRD